MFDGIIRCVQGAWASAQGRSCPLFLPGMDSLLPVFLLLKSQNPLDLPFPTSALAADELCPWQGPGGERGESRVGCASSAASLGSQWGCPCPRLVVLLHAWCKLHLSGDTPLAHPEPYTDASWHGIWRILWGCLSALGWVSRLWEAEMLAGPPLTLPLGQSIGQAADRRGNLSKVNLKSAPHWWQRLGCLAGSALAQSVSQESSPS